MATNQTQEQPPATGEETVGGSRAAVEGPPPQDKPAAPPGGSFPRTETAAHDEPGPTVDGSRSGVEETTPRDEESAIPSTETNGQSDAKPNGHTNGLTNGSNAVDQPLQPRLATSKVPSLTLNIPPLTAQKPPSGLPSASSTQPPRGQLGSFTRAAQIGNPVALTQPLIWRAGVVGQVDNYGISCTISSFRPKVQYGDCSFLTAYVSNDDSSHPQQSIQAGWLRAPGRSFSPNSVDTDLCQLYVYFSTIGETNAFGDNVQGYNDSVKGWVQTGGFRPGIDTIPASHIDGTQGSIQLKFQLQGDRWNLQLNGKLIGYYPTSLFTANVPDVSETLADHATTAGFYGLVYDAMSGGLTPTDMGSGKFPDEGYQRSAFFGNMQYQPKPTAKAPTMADADNSWTKFVDDSGRYDCQVAWKSSTQWHSYMYIGGPGCEAVSWANWESLGGYFLPAVQITAISRKATVIDLFMTGLDGRVYTSWWFDDDWSGFNNDWQPLDWGQGLKFSPTIKIAAVARTQDNLDIFAIGTDSKVYTAWWSQDQNWRGWRKISDEAVSPASLIAAVSRSEGQLDVFVANVNSLWACYWTDRVTDWSALATDQEPNKTWDRQAIPGIAVSLSVLSRAPQSMDVIVGVEFPLNPTLVYCNTWSDGNWTGFISTGSVKDMATAKAVAAVAKRTDRIDLFVVSDNGGVYRSHGNNKDGWSGVSDQWYPIEGTPTTFNALSNIVAISRKPSVIDIFVLSTDLQIYTASRDELANARWSSWRSIGSPQGLPLASLNFAACSRNHQSMVVMVLGLNAKIWSAEWLDPVCGPRPFYCLAHNPNHIPPNPTNKDDIDISLRMGANALGPDINKVLASGALVVSHGGVLGTDPGEATDPTLVSYLQLLRTHAENNPQLALVIFDCKKYVWDAQLGRQILNLIRTEVTDHVSLDVILSVSNKAGAVLFDQIYTDLREREGICVDEEDDPDWVAQHFRDHGVTSHGAFGYGISIWQNLIPGKLTQIARTMERAASIRTGDGGLQNVFAWTVDTPDHQVDHIRIGVNGVMSNFEYDTWNPLHIGPVGLPELMDTVNNSLEMRRLIRLATREDRALMSVPGYVLIVKTGHISAAVAADTLTFMLRGDLGVAKTTIDPSKYARMESEGVDYVTVQSRDIGNLIDLSLWNDLPSNVPSWKCETIRVVSAAYKVDRTVVFNTGVYRSRVVTRKFE